MNPLPPRPERIKRADGCGLAGARRRGELWARVNFVMRREDDAPAPLRAARGDRVHRGAEAEPQALQRPRAVRSRISGERR